MLIYIIRHGETDYNLTHRFQGMWVESHLTEKGKAQARAASSLLAGIDFDHLYVSAAERTRETAALIFPDRTDAIYYDELREVDVGSLADMLVEDARKLYQQKCATAMSCRDYSPFGGESPDDLNARAKGIMDRIVAAGGEKIAVVSHGGIIRSLIWALTGIDPSSLVLLPNCSFAVIDLRDGKGILQKYGIAPPMDTAANEAL